MATTRTSELKATQKSQATHSLVIGVDGSGKSTFLDGLQKRFGVETIEVTSSPESRAFKHAWVDTPIDLGYVATRRALYLDLNRDFEQRAKAALEAGKHVATGGLDLVTLVSHTLMAQIINPGSSIDNIDNSVKLWLESDEIKPDNVVLIHAPNEVILDRIMDRQQRGDTDERFWGFNSPHFLQHYQESWNEVIEILNDTADMNCMRLDSSALSPPEMIDYFGIHGGIIESR